MRLAKMAKILFGVSLIVVSFTTSNADVRIGVNDFENMNNNPLYDWLSMALAETISNRLSNIKEIQVIEKSQMKKVINEIQFSRSGLVDPMQAKEFGSFTSADFIIVGSYQTGSDELRVNARIVDVNTADVISSVEANGVKEDVYRIQNSIAEQLIPSLIPANRNAFHENSHKNNPQISFSGYKSLHRARLIIEELPKFKLSTKRKKDFSKYMQGLDYIEEFLEDNTPTIESMIFAGLLHLHLDNTDQARSFFRRAIEIAPYSAEAHYYMGNFHYTQREEKTAKDYFGKAVEIDPTHAWSHYVLALIERDNNNDLKAMIHLCNALQYKPDLEEAYFFVESLSRSKNDGMPCIEYMQKHINSPEANFIIAMTEARNGRYDNATKHFDNVLNKYDNMAIAHYYYGIHFKNHGNITASIESFKKALKLYPTHPDTNHELAKIYFSRSDCENAVIHYKKYLMYAKRGKDFKEARLRINECNR